jgi:hypothetical protein
MKVGRGTLFLSTEVKLLIRLSELSEVISHSLTYQYIKTHIKYQICPTIQQFNDTLQITVPECDTRTQEGTSGKLFIYSTKYRVLSGLPRKLQTSSSKIVFYLYENSATTVERSGDENVSAYVVRSKIKADNTFLWNSLFRRSNVEPRG